MRHHGFILLWFLQVFLQQYWWVKLYSCSIARTIFIWFSDILFLVIFPVILLQLLFTTVGAISRQLAVFTSQGFVSKEKQNTQSPALCREIFFNECFVEIIMFFSVSILCVMDVGFNYVNVWNLKQTMLKTVSTGQEIHWHSSFSIIHNSLPNPGRILPALIFNGLQPLNVNAC